MESVDNDSLALRRHAKGPVNVPSSVSAMVETALLLMLRTCGQWGWQPIRSSGNEPVCREDPAQPMSMRGRC